jgi:hypothetical protein
MAFYQGLHAMSQQAQVIVCAGNGNQIAIYVQNPGFSTKKPGNRFS